MLSHHGHEVGCYTRRSQEIAGPLAVNVKPFWAGTHSSCASAAVPRQMEESEPDLAHVQNPLPLISPSALKTLGG